MMSSFFADATESKKTAVIVVAEAVKFQVDANGKAFLPGSIIIISGRTTANGKSPVRAHSVPRAPYESFNLATGQYQRKATQAAMHRYAHHRASYSEGPLF